MKSHHALEKQKVAIVSDASEDIVGVDGSDGLVTVLVPRASLCNKDKSSQHFPYPLAA